MPGFSKAQNTFKSKIGSGAAWSLLEGLFAQAIGLIVFIINTHYLDPSAFGALAAAIVAVEFMRQLVFFPLTSSVNSQKDVSDEDYSSVLALTAFASILFCALLLALYNQLDGFSPGARLSALAPFMAASTVLSGLSLVYEAKLIRNLQFRSIAIRSIVSAIGGGAVGVMLASRGYGVWSLVWQQIVQQSLALVTVVIFSRWCPSFALNVGSAQRITRFAAHLSLNNLVGFVGYQADTIATASYLGARDTGLFNSAKRIGTALNQVTIKPLERVALPALVQFSGDTTRLRQAYLRAMGVTALGTAPVFVGVALLSREIVELLLGSKWSDAAPVLSVLSISSLFSTMAQYNSAIVMVSRKPKFQSILSVVGIILGVAILMISVPYGIIGVALAVALKAVLMFPLATLISVRLTQSSFKDVLVALLPALSASTLMAVCILVVADQVVFTNLIADILFKTCLGATMYALTLWLFFRRQVKSLVQLNEQAATVT
jgi:teichuronic acid exporter